MKVGDKVKVIARKCGHNFMIGEVVTLCTLETESGHRFQDDSGFLFWMTDDEYEVMQPTTGPVITETVTYTKIVPGTFGPVKIVRGDFGCDVIVGVLNTDDTDQMIAARDILSQLIDATEDN